MARLLRKDDRSKKAQQLLAMAEYVLDAGEHYYVLFRSKVKSKKEEFQFKVSSDVHKRIKQRARKEGMTISQLVCKWIDEYEGLPDVGYRTKGEKLTNGILVYTPKRLREKIQQMAEKLGVSMSEVVRNIIEEKLKES